MRGPRSDSNTQLCDPQSHKSQQSRRSVLFWFRASAFPGVLRRGEEKIPAWSIVAVSIEASPSVSPILSRGCMHNSSVGNNFPGGTTNGIVHGLRVAGRIGSAVLQLRIRYPKTGNWQFKYACKCCRAHRRDLVPDWGLDLLTLRRRVKSYTEGPCPTWRCVGSISYAEKCRFQILRGGA